MFPSIPPPARVFPSFVNRAFCPHSPANSYSDLLSTALLVALMATQPPATMSMIRSGAATFAPSPWAPAFHPPVHSSVLSSPAMCLSFVSVTSSPQSFFSAAAPSFAQFLMVSEAAASSALSCGPVIVLFRDKLERRTWSLQSLMKPLFSWKLCFGSGIFLDKVDFKWSDTLLASELVVDWLGCCPCGSQGPSINYCDSYLRICPALYRQ